MGYRLGQLDCFNLYREYGVNANLIPSATWPWLLTTVVILVLGLILWLESVRAARALVTLLMVALGAFAGLLIPALWHANLARLTTVITGVIAGLILGGLLFRITQAVLAAFIAAAILVGIASFYDGAWTSKAAAGTVAVKVLTSRPAPSTQGVERPANGATSAVQMRAVSHSGTLRDTQGGIKLGRVKPVWLWQSLVGVYKNVQSHLGKISETQRNEMYAMAAGVGLVALLLGIVFPKATSLVGGAWLGPLLIFASLALFGHWYRPEWLAWAFQRLHVPWVFVACGVVGMAVQYRHVHRRKKKKKKDSPDEKK